jgi:hypothetical protein
MVLPDCGVDDDRSRCSDSYTHIQFHTRTHVYANAPHTTTGRHRSAASRWWRQAGSIDQSGRERASGRRSSVRVLKQSGGISNKDTHPPEAAAAAARLTRRCVCVCASVGLGLEVGCWWNWSFFDSAGHPTTISISTNHPPPPPYTALPCHGSEWGIQQQQQQKQQQQQPRQALVHHDLSHDGSARPGWAPAGA